MTEKFSRLVPVVLAFGLGIQCLPSFAQGYNNGYQQPNYGNGAPYAGGTYGALPPRYQGHVTYVPAGMNLSVRLSTSISTDAATPGDLVAGTLDQPVQLPNGYIPAGARLEGTITNAKAGGFLGRSGQMTMQFNRLILPNGQTVPITAHVNGEIGKYKVNGEGGVAGEGVGTKVVQTVGRGAVGAGIGAALGTAVGAIAGGGSHRPWYQGGGTYAGRGAGRGAWSGAAIGGGIGVADGLLLRKGKNVVIPAGTTVQLLLDSPAQIADTPVGTY